MATCRSQQRRAIAFPQAARLSGSPGKLQSVDASFEVRDSDQVVLALGTYDRSRGLVIESDFCGWCRRTDRVAENKSLLPAVVSGVAADGRHRARRRGRAATKKNLGVTASLPVAFRPGRHGRLWQRSRRKRRRWRRRRRWWWRRRRNPATLAFGTYLGGSADDEGLAIAVDGSGNVFVAGDSASSNFPGSPSLCWRDTRRFCNQAQLHRRSSSSPPSLAGRWMTRPRASPCKAGISSWLEIRRPALAFRRPVPHRNAGWSGRFCGGV